MNLINPINSIQNGYFMHEGLIINVKILSCEGIKSRKLLEGNITEYNTEKYPYINYDKSIYLSKEFKIQSCEDIYGKSKGINNVRKYIQTEKEFKKESKKEFELKFRINKEVVLSECIDYLFFKKSNPSKLNYCGIVKLYDENGDLKEEYFNNNGKYEGKRKIYEYKFYENINRIKHEYNYIDGKKNGIQICYYDTGLKEYETNYVNDVIQGEQNVYYSNGNLAHIKIYENGKCIGFKN